MQKKNWMVLTLVPLFLLAGVIGCQQTAVEGPGGKKLTLTKPADQTIRQGETNQIRIAINRDNFRDAVTVRFDDLPAGVELSDRDRKIAAADSSANFTLKATADAALVENHVAKVTVEGPDGMKATETFKLSVRGK